jgi:hypothetical protein
MRSLHTVDTCRVGRVRPSAADGTAMKFGTGSTSDVAGKI